MTNSTDMQALENNLQTDDSFKQKQALLKLLTSEDLAELPAISNSKLNIFTSSSSKQPYCFIKLLIAFKISP